ncbi:MAG: PIG-L family deacetylase [Saprospiraceae bacterium]|nr:PIG-L family deacetylase [Saprospiraceae bacterium]
MNPILKASTITLFLSLFTFSNIHSQYQKIETSGEIYNALEKFGVLANVLYVAAHPDDENTRMISYLSNEVKANTRYLSLTRGDGGQNLIGPEIKELLGVIRTQELLAARRVDGGSQMFTRANDFGYSKNAEETIKIWDDEQVLSDVVWAIRKFRPDVIINRFDHRTSGRTHGHHTASAMLSHKAWDLIGDPTQFPDQLKYVEPWQPQRLFMNTSWWFYGSRENFAKADKTNLMSVDIGVYYPILGTSNNEIAAESRSQHVCQGMGSTPRRGSQLEYFELLKGDMPPNKADVFEGINTTWSRVKGGEVIETKLKNVIDEFSFRNPSASLPLLAEIRNDISALEDDFWKSNKLPHLDKIIAACAGLFMETNADNSTATPGSTLELSTEVIKRLKGDVTLLGLSVTNTDIDTTLSIELGNNEGVLFDHTITIPLDAPTSSAYWLKESGSLGMYKVDDRTQIGKPESDRYLIANYTIDVHGSKITLSRPVDFKYTNPEKGEVHQPLEIVEPIYTSISDKVYIFEGGNSKKVNVTVKAMKENQSGEVTLDVPEDWTIEPKSFPFTIENKGEENNYTFKVTPPIAPQSIEIHPVAIANGIKYDRELFKIDYNHIPLQQVSLPAKAKFVNLDIKKLGFRIAYIEGAGDEIPSSLEQIGYEVTFVPLESVSAEYLGNFNAVILGIRAYNKWDDIKFKQDEFMEYVEQGGNMIVQYNTNRRLKVDNIGPYPIKLSRSRVSVEEAPVRFLAPNHKVLNFPNKITQADFDGWVQERGLYFAGEWDDKYEAILSSNDPGEEALKGGLLIAKYGEGYFSYSGYSWFRNLPAGVPGAYRLFANLISLGNDEKP